MSSLDRIFLDILPTDMAVSPLKHFLPRACYKYMFFLFLIYQINIIRYPALPDIRQGNLVSGRIPDIKKKAGLSCRPDIWCIPSKNIC
jgi:hypothetical protein